MEKSEIKIEAINKLEPFKVPEGYFEDFVADIMLKLPERPVENPKVISLWERVKPWAYMAAMFAGIALMVNLFGIVFNNRQDTVSVYASESLNLSSSNDIEDFYRYYEDELTEIMYEDTIADFLSDIDVGIITLEENKK